MSDAYESLVLLLEDVQSDAYYRGVKGQPEPTKEQAVQAAWKFVELASQKVGADG